MPFEFAANMSLPGHFRPETARCVADYGHELAQWLGFEVASTWTPTPSVTRWSWSMRSLNWKSRSPGVPVHRG